MTEIEKWQDTMAFIRSNVVDYFGKYSSEVIEEAISENADKEKVAQLIEDIEWTISCINSMKTDLRELAKCLARGS